MRPGMVSYKLSSNETPSPPLPGVVEAAERSVAVMNRYPDMGCADLYAALAERLGVPTDRLAAGTGSVAIELTQLALARIDRACDVTDVIDNVTGAVIGVVVGIVLTLLLRPWRGRRRVS